MSVFGVILVRIFAAFSRIRTEYGEILRTEYGEILRIEYGEILHISPYLVRMRENAGKMRTRIIPNTDIFYAVNL